MEVIGVEAIGRVAQLGELYDARTDQFVNLFLFESIPEEAIKETENKNTKLKYESTNSLKSKFDCLDVSAQIRLPVLSGLIELEGTGKYFKDTKKSAKIEKVSLIQTIKTLKEQININNKGIKCMRDLDILEQIDATHVVVGIQWGGYVFISIEDHNSSNRDIQKIQGSLQGQIANLPLYIRGECNIDQNEIDQINKFNFELYGDIIPEEVPLTLIDAVNFLKKVPTLLKNSNNGKGKAIKYFLTPLSTIRKLWKLDINNNCIIKYIDESLIMRTVDFFDGLNLLEQNLNDFYNDVIQNQFSLKREEVNEITDLRKQFNLFQVKIQRELKESLKFERSGNMGVNNLETLLETSQQNPIYSLDFESSKYEIIKQKISFLDYLKSLNVILINRELNLNDCRRQHFNNDLYVLFFDFKTTGSSDKTIDFFIKFILENKSNEKIFAASEHLPNISTEPGQSLSDVDELNVIPNKISLFKQGKIIIQNYEENSVPDLVKEIIDSKECNQSDKIITILLVGQTGVGKSTFINALANYLLFKSLDEASKAIKCLIPTQFTIIDNQYKEKEINFGQTDSAYEGKYQTYTRNCKTYNLKWGEFVLNIIDTPGIGDIENDRTNMKKILSFISQYKEINSICILLKPNNTRLTFEFNYCILEILSHLNISASNNILFLFTNTRSTYYGAGDTAELLKHILDEVNSKSPKDEIKFNQDNIYCLDNEAFRYLVALSEPNNVKFDQEQKINYEQSWKTSADQSERLLSFIKTLNPHLVKDTIAIKNIKQNFILLLNIDKDISEEISKLKNVNTRSKEFTEDENMRKKYIRENDDKIVELYKESEMISKKMTFLAFILGKNSVTPFNSALETYLKQLIANLKSKINENFSQTIDSLELILEENKIHYNIIIEAINREDLLPDPISSEKINEKFEKLFKMKQYGKCIKDSFQYLNDDVILIRPVQNEI